jgi:hypothetical protein
MGKPDTSSRLLLPVLALAMGVILIGCSTTRTTSVITEPGNWVVGQHDYCIYKADKLVCIPQGKEQAALSLEQKIRQIKGEKIKIEDMLFSNGVNIMGQLEEGLQRGEKDLQVSVFDTKFSEKPDDYSVWNCISTGKGSPAVECSMMKQPSAKDKEFISKKTGEREEIKIATAKMSALGHKTLEERCGKPLQRGEDQVSVTELYKGESTLLAFHFNTWPAPEDKLTVAGSLDSPPATLDHHAVLEGKHHWWGGRLEAESPWFLKELPCLNK